MGYCTPIALQMHRGILNSFIFILNIILLVSCKNSDISATYFEKSHTLSFSKDSTVHILNKGDEPAELSIHLNDLSVNDFEELLVKVRALKDEFEGEAEVRKAWRYVAANLDFINPVSQSVLFNEPLLLLNSIGYGQCDDFASVLKSIWEHMGYEARLVNVRDHVVAEVKVDGHWEMYDAFEYVYYLNRNDQVASTMELRADSTLIVDPQIRIGVLSWMSAENYFRYLKRYSSEAVERYCTIRPFLYKDGYDAKETFRIRLWPGCKMEFPVYSPDPVVKRMVASNNVYHKKYIRFTIPKGWKGEFQTPFLITSVHGDGDIILNNKKKVLGDISVKFDYEHIQYLPLSFKVIDTRSDIVVYCMMNENLFRDNNEVDVVNYGLEYDLDVRVTRRTDLIAKEYFLEKRLSGEMPDIFEVLGQEQKGVMRKLASGKTKRRKKEEIVRDIYQLFADYQLQNREKRLGKITQKLEAVLPQSLSGERYARRVDAFGDMHNLIFLVYVLEEYPEDEVERILDLF